MKIRSNIKVSIVDECEQYRGAMKDVLTAQGFTVISETENESAMFRELSIHKPDVLIYDFFNSSERFHLTMGKIKKLAPETKLMVLSFEISQELIDFCFSNGVIGFCDKSITDFKDLVSGIEKIANGEKTVLVSQMVE